MPAIAREKLWTRDFVFGTAVNFLIMVNYYGLMVVVADYAMKTYDAPAATAGLAASIFVIGALIARLFSGRIMDRVVYDGQQWTVTRHERFNGKPMIFIEIGRASCRERV